jgi:hypothetical protein
MAGCEVAAEADQPQQDRVDHPPLYPAKVEAGERAHSSRNTLARVKAREIAPMTAKMARRG